MSKFQTDALRPSALPSANLGRPKHLSRGDGIARTDDLGKSYEEWNKRIDDEVKGLAGGLKTLVDLANIGESPAPHAHTTTALDLQLRTSQLILHTQNLRNIAHDLKLTLLLSDQISLVARRDAEFVAVRREIDKARVELGREMVQSSEEDIACFTQGSGETGDEVTDEGQEDPHPEPSAGTRTELPEEIQPRATPSVKPPSPDDSDEDEDMEEVG